MSINDDRESKRGRVAAIRRRAGAEEILLSSHEAVSWYLDGIRTHVSLAGAPVIAVRAGDRGDRIYVAANEVDRLVQEELRPEDAARVVPVPWQVPPAAAAAEGFDGLHEEEVLQELREARAALLPGEVDRYRRLGRETAEAMTDAAAGLTPDVDEWEAAAALSRELVARAIDPLVVLVGGYERRLHRHPLPAGGALGARAMLVVCGRRGGLVANATRWVGEPGPDDERILAVESAFLRASAPGGRLDEAFAAGCAAYEAAGFAPEEWRRHHQGGPTGYAGRDPRATAATGDRLHDGQAFAWNPTAPGAKVEDTMLLSTAGPEVLTLDPRWPTADYDGLLRPLAMGWEALS